uniref:RING-type E3 ubiquitin transferase n=1 Tax=Aceria tosichella TaxID=561515 RepID=A0A6G1S6D8_9ACAR
MRYFCHHCHTQIPADELLPEFTCPSCQSGFVEEMPSVAVGGSSSSRRNSSMDESQRAGSDDGASGFISTRMSSDEFSDDNSDVDFLESVNGPLAQVFSLFQNQASNDDTTESSNNSAGQSSQQQQPSDSNTSAQQPNRRITRSAARRATTAQFHPVLPNNQSLADVLNDFITGASFGHQYPEGSVNFQGPNAASSSGSTASANRGLINIDFPLPFFLHSNPGDYAWGNAGFDAVITQLLNNLDGSNSGPPPMPKEQVENLPTVKISDEQVKATNLQCTVCMEDFQVDDCARQLPCEHFFHQDCIVPWLNLHASCPICRKTFVTGSNTTTHNLNTSDTPSEIRPTDTSRTSEQTNTTASTAASASGPTTSTTTNRSSAATTTSTTTNASIISFALL